MLAVLFYAIFRDHMSLNCYFFSYAYIWRVLISFMPF